VARYYSKTQIETASKSKAVYMLHERCMYYLLRARSFSSERSRCRDKAQNILSQFQRSLRITDAVSRSLFYLYDYCYICLERGGDPDIAHALEIMGVLRDAFRKLLRRP
jgi:flagellin-specific chaperone FliS